MANGEKTQNRKIQYRIGCLILCCIVVFCGIFPGMALTGCSTVKLNSAKVMDLDFTLVDDQDLPKELKKLIEEKKGSTIRMTYTTKDDTYIVAGYGTQATNGYSIRVNEVYLGSNAIYTDFSLIGPSAGQPVTELPTTPYIVIKIEKRDEMVIIQI